MTKKSSIGRQKIPMKRIQKENLRQVTFSKRRAGLFKKASELCTLCGVEIAIIVFSPAQKPFSFGHPNVESVINRYISSKHNIPSPQPIGTLKNTNYNELNSWLTQVLNELETEKNKGKEIDKMRKAGRAKNWWEAPVDDLNLDELEHLRDALEELKMKVVKQVNKPGSLEPVANNRLFWEVKEDVLSCFESKADPHHQINVASGLSSVYHFAYEHEYL